MSKPPLWEVLHEARVLGEADRFTKAAEIRAVAEWIEKCQVEDYGRVLPDVRDVIDWLTAEADRAERGEVEP